MRVALRVGIYVHAREQKFPFLPFVTKIFHLEGKSLRTVADLVDMPIRVTGQTIRGILRFRSNGTWLLSTYSVLVRIDTPVRAFIYLDLDLSLLKYSSKFISPRENPSFLISRNVGTRLVILSKSVSFDAHRMNGWHRLRYQSLMRNRSVKAVSLSSFERMHYVVPAASH